MPPESRIAKEGAPIRDLVNLLFEVFPRPDGKPYTSGDVAEETGISAGSLGSLRARNYKNVTLGMLQALASFFDIPLDYFACESIEDATLYLARLQAGEPVYEPRRNKNDALVAQIMAKTMVLSVDARQDLLRMVQWLEYGDKHRPKAKRATAESS